MNTTPFKIAFSALRRNKTRTFLTVLGIVIGIASVIAVMSAGQGFESLIVSYIETFGTDTIDVEIKIPSTGKTSTENAMGMATGVEITTLTLDDETAIRRLPNIKNSYAGMIGQQLVSYGSQKKQIILFGVSASVIEIDKTKVAEGRFFTQEEDRGSANVAVLGPKVKEKLFPDEDALNSLIKIGLQKYRVVGVMESRGASFGFDMDDMIYIPIRTLQNKVLGVDHVDMMFLQVYDAQIINETAQDVTELLRERHDITDPDKDDFHATPMTEALDMLDTVFWAISLLLIAVAGVSLVVGGVGIMNIMYVSVIERTYEIGLRKAIGARSFDILLQFLWESTMITFLGTIFGVAFGILISFLISVGASYAGMNWKFIVMPMSLLIACGVSVAIGLFFGVFPARTAAKMDPVTALRYNR